MKTTKEPVEKRSHPPAILNEEIKQVFQQKNITVTSADGSYTKQPADATMDKPENWDEAWFTSYE